MSGVVSSAGRRSRAGGGSVDAGGEERLHQPAQLQPVLGLRLHPDCSRGHRDRDRGGGLLRRAEGDQESSDCGESNRGFVFFFSLVTGVDSMLSKCKAGIAVTAAF